MCQSLQSIQETTASIYDHVGDCRGNAVDISVLRTRVGLRTTCKRFGAKFLIVIMIKSATHLGRRWTSTRVVAQYLHRECSFKLSNLTHESGYRERLTIGRHRDPRCSVHASPQVPKLEPVSMAICHGQPAAHDYIGSPRWDPINANRYPDSLNQSRH